MVPAQFVRLDRVPVSVNGKVDRSALPAPDPEPSRCQSDPPMGPAEELVAQIWSEVLDGAPVGRNDHFFQLGGHSLGATMLVTRLRRELDVRIPVRTLFERPVLADFVETLLDAVEEAEQGTDSSAAR